MPPNHTLVLTAAPGPGVVTDEIVLAASRLTGAAPSRGRWLAPGEAWELAFSLNDDASRLVAAIAAATGNAAIDINIVSGAGDARRKRLLCADMESTIIAQELIDEMADLVGCRAEISTITTAAMRGEIEFEDALTQRVALFAGLEVRQLDAILDRVTLMPGAETVVETMKAHGAIAALVTGGFSLFAERIGERLGFDHVIANRLEIADGRLTGRVEDPILGPQGKADTLHRLARDAGISPVDTLAVGDGANDVAMLAAAGLGVAFRAKPILAAQARKRASGAVIAHGDLTALLYLQGYGREVFTRATAPL